MVLAGEYLITIGDYYARESYRKQRGEWIRAVVLKV